MSGDLRALAEAATPGPWEVLWNAVAYIDTVTDPGDPTGQTPMQEPIKVADAGERDRAYIAAANPSAILALLDERDALAATVARVEALADEYAANGAAREAVGKPAWPNNVARDLRAALRGDS